MHDEINAISKHNPENQGQIVNHSMCLYQELEGPSESTSEVPWNLRHSLPYNPLPEVRQFIIFLLWLPAFQMTASLVLLVLSNIT